MESRTVTLADISIGNTGNYGIGASAVDFSQTLPTYLRITDINDDGTLNKSGLKSVDDPNSFKYQLKPNDIVFARTGASTGRNYFYDGKDGQFVYAGFLIKFSIDPVKAYPKFIKYVCLSQEYNDWVRSQMTGSTRGNMNAQQFGKLPIKLPSLGTQRKIAAILSAIDDKIELNNKVIDNLMEQLRIVFNNSFIVNAKDNWPIKKIGDYLDLERGLSYKGKYLSENKGIPMLNLGNILPNSVFRPEKIKFYTGDYKERHIVKPGDIIVANTDLTQAREVLGSAIRVPNIGYNTVIVSHHISIVKRCSISKNFVWGLLNMPEYRTRVAGFATGTTVLALPNETLLNCEFSLPPQELIDKYDSIAENIHNQIELIRIQNDKLAELRDALLPKLMSGEIDVSKVKVD